MKDIAEINGKTKIKEKIVQIMVKTKQNTEITENSKKPFLSKMHFQAKFWVKTQHFKSTFDWKVSILLNSLILDPQK